MTDSSETAKYYGEMALRPPLSITIGLGRTTRPALSVRDAWQISRGDRWDGKALWPDHLALSAGQGTQVQKARSMSLRF